MVINKKLIRELFLRKKTQSLMGFTTFLQDYSLFSLITKLKEQKFHLLPHFEKDTKFVLLGSPGLHNNN